MIQTYTRYLLSRQIHPESICMISSFSESICTISSLSRSASLRYTEPNTSLIRNLQVSSFVPHLSHQNLIYWWSKSTLGIFPTGKFVRNLYCKSIYKHLPYQNPNYSWSKSILGIFPAGKFIRNQFARFYHHFMYTLRFCFLRDT